VKLAFSHPALLVGDHIAASLCQTADRSGFQFAVIEFGDVELEAEVAPQAP